MNSDRWNELWRRLGVDAAMNELYDEIVDSYEQPQRAYHNFNHIIDCLCQFDSISHLANEPDEIELAIWFHDVVYDSQGSENELRSSQQAVAEMQKAGVAKSRQDAVHELIMATCHNAEPVSNDAALLVDVDLSILGRDELEFEKYDAAIRIEYSWVPEPAYRQGRIGVLKSFLDRETIFHSADFREKYEEQARENLARAIAKLQTD